jgi:predicted ribosome quality control (RQC) complex YloA/Tae2 family protein
MKFREIMTSSGKKVLAGKNAKNNEELINQFKGKENIILHTVAPGSPFCVVDDLKTNKKDIKETAIICASKSQDWRDNKQDVKVHIFTGKDVYKNKGMKIGTFGVKKFNKINVKKEWIKNA